MVPFRVSSSHFHQSSQLRAKQPDNKEEEISDEPVKFSTSSARSHSAYETFLIKRNAPWYQSYVVLGCTSAFLLYFLVLREENDLDEEIGKSLFERIPGLEEKDLLAKISNAKSLGMDSKPFEKRLKEIQSAK